MSEHTYIFSLEELGYALAVHQGEEMAAGLMKAYYGDLSEDRWELLFQAATHSLMSKGFIESIDEENGEVRFPSEITQMIQHLLYSNYMLRGITDRNSNKVLTIHELQQRYLYHLSDNHTLHFLTWTAPADWEEELVRFYGVEPSKAEGPTLSESKVVITEELWNRLTSGEFPASSLHDELSSDQQQLIAKWQQDFQNNARTMDNLSTIRIGSGNQTAIEDILFVLPANEGVWIVRNREADRNEEPQICIELQSFSACRKTLGSFAATLA
ncbi:hypothetical protein PVOR_03730 [Paenibacillus vortex V453]|uniref:Uncharacterized protein n=1 Tax=Paenibacillus vortex V453 TaxID=715225 RepID=A0A2R9T1C1_9BACL|nr:hypothetical protein [Paenibacillus vortex]EFU43433.1 hypothetical protein PVOR_03730 [Paenibacillus vortex V453]